MAPTDLKAYLDLDYAIVLNRDDEGDWIASIKELEGCMADGRTPDEAIKNLQSMKELWLKARARSTRPIPLPEKEQESFSGRWLQRVPKSLHRKLVRAAERDGVSLNQFVTAALAEAVGERTGKFSKDLAVSVLAIQNIDRWQVESRLDQGEWETGTRVSLDRNRRDHGIRSLLRKNTSATIMNPNGRESKSGDEENHKNWDSQLIEVGG